jgi:WD40 repeat protein
MKAATIQEFVNLAFVVIIMSLMASCSILKLAPPEPIATVSINATLDVLDTSIPSITKPLTPSSTPNPTLTPSPTFLPITPVLQGTQLPDHGDVINGKNIERITLLSRWGQGNPWDIAYTPDGKYLVVGASTGLYFYSANDFSLAHYIDTQNAVFHIAISPDSQKIAAVETGKVVLYQTGDWQKLLTIQVDANSADFSADNRMLALGRNRVEHLQLHDVETGEVIDTFKSGQAAWSVEMSPREDVIATGGFSTTIWSLDGSILDRYGPYVSGGHTASVSFSPDGEFLAEGADEFLHIYRVLKNGRIINYREIDLSRYDYAIIFSVAISPNGRMVAATLSTGIGIWDLSTGARVFYVAADRGYTFYNSLAWSMDSKTIAAASNETGVELWNVNTGESVTSLNMNCGSFSSLVWSPDGEKLGVGAEEGIAYIFNSSNGDVANHFGSGYELNSLSFSPDSQTLAVGYDNRIVDIWNLDGELVHTLEGWGFGSSDATFLPDGSLFAATSPESWQTPPQVRFWNTRDWSVEKIFPVGDQDNFMITGFVLAPDQSTGAISYVDMNGVHKDTIKIVSIADGTSITILEPKNRGDRVFIDSMAYSPDNKLLAVLVSDPDPRILVWQTSDWSLLYDQTIYMRSRLGRSKNQQDTLAWSPDSTLIAVGLMDGSIKIFEAMNGEKLSALNGHTMGTTGVSFSPDGRVLASISIDGTVMLWGLR